MRSSRRVQSASKTAKPRASAARTLRVVEHDALVHLAGEAPVGGEVHEDRTPGAALRRDGRGLRTGAARPRARGRLARRRAALDPHDARAGDEQQAERRATRPIVKSDARASRAAPRRASSRSRARAASASRLAIASRAGAAADDPEQPDDGREQREAEPRAQLRHPGPRARQPARPAGERATPARTGSARPTPIARKIAKMTGASLAKAKPTAVPRKGAEHGVASTTASRPSKKRAPGAGGLRAERRQAAGIDADLEDAEQVDREDDQHARDRRDEERLLELEAPADGGAGACAAPPPPPRARPGSRARPRDRRGRARAPRRAGGARARRSATALSASTGSTHGIRLSTSPPSRASSERLREAARAARARRAGCAPASARSTSTRCARAVAVDEREHAGEPRRRDVRLRGPRAPRGSRRRRRARRRSPRARRRRAGRGRRRARRARAARSAARPRQGRTASEPETDAPVAGAVRDGSPPRARRDAERRRRERNPLRGVVEERAHGAAARARCRAGARARGSPGCTRPRRRAGRRARARCARRGAPAPKTARVASSTRPCVAVGREEPLRLAEGGRARARRPARRRRPGRPSAAASRGPTRPGRASRGASPDRARRARRAAASHARHGVVRMHEQARLDARLAAIEGALRASARRAPRADPRAAAARSARAPRRAAGARARSADRFVRNIADPHRRVRRRAHVTPDPRAHAMCRRRFASPAHALRRSCRRRASAARKTPDIL